MRAYAAVFGARLRVLLQYRGAALAGFGTQLFWGLIRVMIFGALFESSRSEQPMNYAHVVSYIWLGQAFFAMLPWNIDSEVKETIRSGNVAYEMVRPVDLHLLWFTRALALRVVPTTLRALPMLISALLFLNLTPPASLGAGIAWLGSMVLAFVLSAAITTCLAVSLLWTISGEGVNRVVPPLVTFLSGSIVPLPFFPDWARPIVETLPFRGLIDVPFRFYLGHYDLSRFPREAIFQLTWIVALFLGSRALLALGTRRLVVQGG